MYSPTLGRWIQNDPIEYEAGDPNLYRFVGNDPVDMVDPLGLDRYSGNSIDNLLQQKGRADELGLPGDIINDVTPRVIKSGITLHEGGEIGDWAIATSATLTNRIVTRVKGILAASQALGGAGATGCCPERDNALAHHDDILNAVRHLLWQASITVKYGNLTAHAVANVHDDPTYFKSQDQVIDRYNNVIARAIGSDVLRKLQGDPANRIDIASEVVTAIAIGKAGRGVTWKWQIDRFKNWADYKNKVLSSIEDKVFDLMVRTLLSCSRTKHDSLPITSPSHPYLSDNPNYSKLPPY